MRNQELKTVDMMILFCMFVALVGFAAHVVIRGQQDSLALKAQRSAENISAQLLSMRLKNLQFDLVEKGRNVASQDSSEELKKTKVELGPHGIIGKDPWGHPFHYKFVADEKGKSEVLMVWSAGPDGKVAKQYESLGFKQARELQDHLGASDDIGTVAMTP
ncbi:MAG: type II secretion system protein GspG [Bdellovibrionales bacterium]|nr:type II secretion system protein GspG [Bdellovibrionales bacterium]